jgi:hypothetical protein
VASSAVSSAKVAVIDSGGVGRSAVYSMYITLGHCLGYARIDGGEFRILSFNLYEEVSAMQIGF